MSAAATRPAAGRTSGVNANAVLAIVAVAQGGEYAPIEVLTPVR
jgi:hypothetical protein